MSKRAKLRQRAGLTQVQLGNLAGVPQTHICQWERGDRELKPLQVARIAQVLDEHLKQTPVFRGPEELVRVLAHTSSASVAA